jgi:hypothetical protein
VIVRQAAPAPDPGTGRRKKKYLLWIAGLAIVGACAWGLVWYLEPAPPDPETAPAKEVTAYLASKRFAKLSDAKKDEYSERIAKLPVERRREISPWTGLTLQQRFRAADGMSRAWHREQVQKMRDFFKLSPEEQVAALDKLIAEQKEAAAKAVAARAAAAKNPPTGAPSAPAFRLSADQMQVRIEQLLSNGTPEERALSRAYWARVNARRQELQAGGQ